MEWLRSGESEDEGDREDGIVYSVGQLSRGIYTRASKELEEDEEYVDSPPPPHHHHHPTQPALSSQHLRRKSDRKRKPPARYAAALQEEDSGSAVTTSNTVKRNRKGQSPKKALASSLAGTQALTSSAPAFPLLQLPYEILLHVFCLLDEQTINSLDRVCHAFHLLCNDPSIWKGLSYKKWKICDVVTYNYNWKDLYKDNNKNTQRGWFRFVVPKFSTTVNSECYYSPPYQVGTQSWSLLIFPRGNMKPFLAVYLSVRGTYPHGNREASFSCVLLNQKDPSRSIERACVYSNFEAGDKSENEDWGFTKFIELEKLHDPNEGFLVNDTLVFDVYVAHLGEIEYWLTLLKCSDEDLQAEACTALTQSSYIDENKVKIVQKGAFPYLLTLLNSNNIELHKRASDALWNLTEDDKNKTVILSEGWLGDYWIRLVELLKSKNLEIQRNVLNILWNLSTIDEFNQNIVAFGTLPALIEFLQSEVVDHHLSAIHVLWNLSFTDDEIRNQIVLNGAIPLLAKLLTSKREDILANALNLLHNLAEEGDHPSEILEVVSLQLLMAFVRHKNPDVAKNALHLLANLVEGNATVILEIEKSGGVNELISLLYCGNEEVVGESAKTLSRLMYYHKIKELDSAIIARLLEMLRSNTKKKIENGILALLRVALHEQNKVTITDLGALDVIIPLLSHPDVGIKGDTSILVTNLSTNIINRTKIIDKGGLDALMVLINSADKYPKKFAACAIATLSRDKRTHARLIGDEFLDILLSYLVSTDSLEGCSHIGYSLAKMKDCHVELASKLKMKGFIRLVLQAIQSYDPGKHKSEKSEEKDFTPPHLPLCCKINLLGYCSLISGLGKHMEELATAETLMFVLDSYKNPYIEFLVRWTLCMLQNGPQSITLAKTKYRLTGFMKVLPNSFQVRNDSCFLESILLNTKFVSLSGKYYYEVQCASFSSLCLIGFATKKHQFRIPERRGVGDDEDSWAFEMRRGLKWFDNYPICYGEAAPRKSRFNVVGCALDLDAGEISFHLNGKPLGVAFSGLNVTHEYCPALSLANGQQCQLNFGAKPLSFLPSGFQPLDPRF